MRRLVPCLLLLAVGCTAAPSVPTVPSAPVPPTVTVSTPTSIPTVAPTVAVVLPVDVPRIEAPSAPPTATAVESEAGRATRLERDYPAVDPRQLTAEPAAFLGQKLHVRGLMADVRHDSAANLTRVRLLAQIDAAGRGSEPLVVELPRDTTLLRGECRSFFGTIEGDEDGVPLLRATESLVRYLC